MNCHAGIRVTLGESRSACVLALDSSNYLSSTRDHQRAVLDSFEAFHLKLLTLLLPTPQLWQCGTDLSAHWFLTPATDTHLIQLVI